MHNAALLYAVLGVACVLARSTLNVNALEQFLLLLLFFLTCFQNSAKTSALRTTHIRCLYRFSDLTQWRRFWRRRTTARKRIWSSFFPYQKHMGSWSLRQYDFNCQLFFCAVLTLNDYFFHVDKLTALMASRLSGWQCQWNFTQWILNWPMHF